MAGKVAVAIKEQKAVERLTALLGIELPAKHKVWGYGPALEAIADALEGKAPPKVEVTPEPSPPINRGKR